MDKIWNPRAWPRPLHNSLPLSSLIYLIQSLSSNQHFLLLHSHLQPNLLTIYWGFALTGTPLQKSFSSHCQQQVDICRIITISASPPNFFCQYRYFWQGKLFLIAMVLGDALLSMIYTNTPTTVLQIKVHELIYSDFYRLEKKILE